MKDICLDEDHFVDLTKLLIKVYVPAYRKEDLNIWIGSKEAMGLLGIQSATFLKYRNEDLIVYSQLSDRHYLYNKPSIISFIESKANKPWKK